MSDPAEPGERADVEASDPAEVEAPKDWSVYVLVSERLTRTYVGIALDAAKRLEQHNGETPGGARSTRAGRPWSLARTYGPYPDRATAQRAEAALKRERGRARLDWSGLAE